MTSAKVIAAFVADPTCGDTVFVGLWEVGASTPKHTPDPYDPQPPVPGRSYVTIELSRMTALDTYAGRLVVDWGKSERAWVQYAHRRNKEIVELRRQIEEPAFPGFGTFRCPLNEVEALPTKWLEVLRLIKGVYLLVHRATGAQYVGSAIGADGFIGRWRGYSSGHGGNVALKELGHPAAEYDVAVLDTVGLNATPDEVYQLESSWKTKLGSRAQGLNRN